ncbi:TPA: hypothetical protein HA239_04645 [Candidatus Woesearchaeota archaeon]|nr:hypothetical protein QT06_C0001G0109 [archaeon GW2011_AR15]MBS3104086.1 hypothetical protein [Candidatus Woesearchaeota archaeon]HIH41677.1 hypothetical protein [Candidatus Woesearchaeota archaeon]
MIHNAVKIVSLIFIFLLSLNLLLLALGKISVLLFWIILLLGAVASFLINRVIKQK